MGLVTATIIYAEECGFIDITEAHAESALTADMVIAVDALTANAVKAHFQKAFAIERNNQQ